MRHFLQTSLLLSSVLTAFACSPSSEAECLVADADCDGVPDALGTAIRDENGTWAKHDFDDDGIGDGYAVDINGDGISDGILIDTDGDGFGDSLDRDGDLVADVNALGEEVGGDAGAGGSPAGSGGANPTGAGGTVATGSGGAATTAGGCVLGEGEHSGKVSTSGQYAEANVKRSGQSYKFIANGWGQNWNSHDISVEGTTMTVNSFDGSRQDNGAPAGYPSLFCGKYSDKQSNECGLPRALSSIASIDTGLSWSHPTGDGTYNVAYDVWMGNSGSLTSYFMVWFKNPQGENPAGRKTEDFVSVAGVDGVWDLYTGTVNNLPIVNYVRPNGQEANSLAFDMMDFINDANAKGLNFPGAEVLSVAIGFEIWEGPVTGLSVDDFCVSVQ